MPTRTAIHPALILPILVVVLIAFGVLAFDFWGDHSTGIADLRSRGGVQVAERATAPEEYDRLMKFQVFRLCLCGAFGYLMWRLHAWWRKPEGSFH